MINERCNITQPKHSFILELVAAAFAISLSVFLVVLITESLPF